MTTPRFAQIKSHLEQEIHSGAFVPGDRVPSENELCQQFDVSRMTARRALQELTEEGMLIRTPGLGSFVAEHRPISSTLEIRNIADEVMQRGHRYRADIRTVAKISANKQQAWLLNVEENATLFHSIIVHYEDDTPIQWEDRLVNPAMAPDYLEQDFSQITPNAYLSKVAPLTEASHKIEASLVNPGIVDALKIESSEPCLQISRRTWSAKGVVSLATLIHPGSRFCLGGHMTM